MKKSLSRFLSLALVLAMLISVVPFAMAAQSVTISEILGNNSVTVGGTTHLSAQVTVTGEPDDDEEALTDSITWESSNDEVATVSSDGTVTGVSVGTATITATAAADTSQTSSMNVIVSKAELTPQISATTMTLVVGSYKSLNVTVPGLTESTDYTVEWSGENEAVSFENGDVSADEVGSATLVATVTLTSEGEAKATLTTNQVSCLVTVTDAYTIEASDITLSFGEAETISATVMHGDVAAEGGKLTAASTSELITVKDMTVTAGKKAGTAKVTLTYTPADGTAAVTKEITVTVTESGLSCDSTSVLIGSTADLTASVKNLPEGVTPTYTWACSDGRVTLSSTTGSTIKVTGKTAGKSTVTLTAKYTPVGGTEVTLTKNVYVSVYSDVDINVSMKSGISSFKFGSTTALNEGKVLSTLMKQSLNTTNGDISYIVQFSTMGSTAASASLTVPTGNGSSQSGKYAVLADLDNVTLTANDSSKVFSFSYWFKGQFDGLTYGAGTVTVDLSGNAGDIVYETDYKTSVTFDEDDFEKFWNSVYPAATNTLKYVEFTSMPAYGTLYTTAAKTTAVTKTMAFQPNYAGASGYRDLDTVTYEPSTKYTSAYTVTIPFTAYGGSGTSALTTLTGTVVIELNGNSSTITSRGVVFGTGTKSIVDEMVADYKEAKGGDLACVTFALPDVEDGRLYYNYNGILGSTRVSSKDVYYVDATTKQLDLEKVAFIPAAGTTGKVTINYIGYDKDGKNAYEGKIVLNVTAKEKSDKFTDVTSSSYSWAADSIDFLYYEEVVNGTSSTKFGPSASITRGDFMIMLYRAFLEEDYGTYNVTSNFADVPKGTSAYEKETYQAVGVAKYLGIAKGDGTNFKPKSSITREEAMTLIYRTLEEVDLDLEYTSTKTTASFSDYSKVSTYAQTSITYLIKHGIVIGSNGQINPKSNITRAEMAVILHRVLTY